MSESVMPPAEVERWRVVADFPHYEVSDLGRVRSLDRVIPCRNRWGGIWERRYKGRVLKLGVNNHGYWSTTLYRDQAPHTVVVHVLVAKAFLDPPLPGQEVCHGPNGKLDNRASQLRYDSHVSNMADCLRDGTVLRGYKNPQAKLAGAAVADIRSRARTGKRGTQTKLALEYGVSVATISMIVNRKIWPHIP